MVKIVDIFGEIGADVTLLDIKKELSNLEKVTQLHVRINSPGGGVVEGRAIRAFLLSLNKEITTECFGDCSSIATEIFLAGKRRIANEGVRFLIHQPYTMFIGGTHDDLNTYKNELETIEKEMIELYMNRDKNKKYSYEDWKEMLHKNKVFTATELLELGFATEIKKAYQSKVLDMKKRTSFFAKLQRLLRNVKALTFTQNDQEFEVITESDTPQVGDEVILVETGEPVADGEYQYDETTVLVVSGGVITEILVNNADLEQTLEAFAKAIADLKSENAAIKKALKEALKTEVIAFKQDKNVVRNFQPTVKFKKNFNK